MTAAEKKVNAFCARHHIGYEWQATRFNGLRAVIATPDRITHEALLKAARRLRGVRVTELRDRYEYESGVFDGHIYLQDADDAARIDKAIESERERNENWWAANHHARLSGMDPEAAAQYAESLYPMPATV